MKTGKKSRIKQLLDRLLEIMREPQKGFSALVKAIRAEENQRQVKYQ